MATVVNKHAKLDIKRFLPCPILLWCFVLNIFVGIAKLKDNFNLTLTTENKVLEILRYTDIWNAAGIDKISQMFLRDGTNILAKLITEICNTSIFSGLFPSDCKIARLKRPYKKRSKTNHRNYRPISLLPLKAKVIERMVYNQVNSFLLQNNIL